MCVELRTYYVDQEPLFGDPHEIWEQMNENFMKLFFQILSQINSPESTLLTCVMME